jgi:broad specificity polyphosphatase/5'/3'-nucleotidase SurE
MQDFCAATQASTFSAQQVLERWLPPGVLLNVNVPLCPWEEINGFSITLPGMSLADHAWMVLDLAAFY